MRTTTILLALTAVLFVSSCVSVKSDWEHAQTSSTTGALKEFLQKHPDSQYATEAKGRIEKLDWERTQASNTIEAFKEFLQKHPDSQHTTEAKGRIEKPDWERTQASNTIGEFRKFLQKHPDSQYARQAQSKISAFCKEAWEKAQKKDKIYSYDSFIRAYPDSEFSKKAKERSDWQRANPAVVKIDYPETVKAGGRYRWDTVFKETGGKAGFKLRATNFYIQDPSGGNWSNSWSESVEVKPGGRGTVDYWCDSSSKWDGGHYYTTWVGEDDWGNKISIVQKVHLAK